MNVTMIMMRKAGVELPRGILNDRYTMTYTGELVILDTADQRLHRPLKIARMMKSAQAIACELLEAQIVWVKDDKLMLTGFERIKDAQGIVAEFKQSWHCTISPVVIEAGRAAPSNRKREPQRGSGPAQ